MSCLSMPRGICNLDLKEESIMESRIFETIPPQKKIKIVDKTK